MAKKPQSSELHSGPGFRIRSRFERPAPSLIERFRHFETPDISDMLNRLYTISGRIKNLINDQPIAGPALTVKVYPGDNLMVHKALDLAKPGDVVVVDAGGNRSHAVLGDLVAHKAKHRGIHAFVIDGLIRDYPGTVEVELPIYARGVTPVGPLHRGPGEINYPVSCGGIVVFPGDIIVGDVNGVVVVRQDFADDILLRLQEREAALKTYIESVKRGQFSNEWVAETLASSGCLTEE